MLKFVLHLLLVMLASTSESDDILEALNLIPHVARTPDTTFLDTSCFPSLQNYEVNAKAATESNYPWIARVIHSRSADMPHVCTASCIDEGIYITAARCIYTLKVKYTTVHHMSKRFEVRAFVVPSNPTKQMFDDIGFIVIDKKHMKGVQKWSTIELFNKVNRTDETFIWFAELEKTVGKIDYKVVGYAAKKGIHKISAADRQYDLTELDVVVGHELCYRLLEQFRNGTGYKLPCYHSCTAADQIKKKKVAKCVNYHGVEGGALIDKKSNKLVGVATWGVYYVNFELPVGFSVVNSENFFKDLTCARLIWKDDGSLLTKGYYQNLCDSNQ